MLEFEKYIFTEGEHLMRAITVKRPGGAEQLQITEQPKPIPGDGELLIKIKAAAVNRTDIVNRESESSYLENPIFGVEIAGIVEEAPEDSPIKVETRVMGLVNGGGYAEYVTMPANRAMIIPDTLSFEEGAAIPEVFLTAYQTLYLIGNLQKDETVLIHAGGSGVGTAAIQLAKKVTGANVITTAGSRDKLAFATELGADITINYKEQKFSEEIAKVTDGNGVDLILDFVGASYWQDNLASIKIDGRWVLIGILGGTTVENMNIMDLMLKRVTLTGTLLTPRSDAYKEQLTTAFSDHVLNLFHTGALKPIVSDIFTFEQIKEAHEHMESNKNTGKIIITLPE